MIKRTRKPSWKLVQTSASFPCDISEHRERDQEYSSDDYPPLSFSPSLRYKSADELESFPTYGRLGTYGGGGYVLPVRGSSSEILERLDYLQKVNWIDKYTRAVMLEFSVYNANVRSRKGVPGVREGQIIVIVFCIKKMCILDCLLPY